MKNLTALLMAFSLSISISFAQKVAPTNWYNLDLKRDKVPGVSTEKAYSELLKNKTATQVIVAVIDGGTEIDHEDLKSVIWTNTNEIAGNNIDDDKNGYVDDIHGWNFIGGKNGDVNEDNLEIARVYKLMTEKYLNISPIKGDKEYEEYIKVKTEFEKRKKNATNAKAYYVDLIACINEISKTIGNQNPTEAELKSYLPKTEIEKKGAEILKSASKKKVTATDIISQLNRAIEYYNKQITVHLNSDLNTREIVGDNYADLTERYYGNNSYEGPSGDHGTHVAGIIAAVRNNDKGMMGVANNVKILIVRVVPDGDERDKDIANGIRYAVDNGASIINMSFGKSHSPFKSTVDDAVKYAVSKNVLFVHAAGNDASNTDTINNFPRDTYLNNTGVASSWLEIGASSWKKGKFIAADFSNYGKENVDVFAPGVDIYSTIPDSKYASFNGTSMAAPVTAGVAALVRSYYPTLTATQVKDVIMQSSIKVKGKVVLPGNAKRKVKMEDLCQTGGIVNAYEAIKLAEMMVNKK